MLAQRRNEAATRLWLIGLVTFGDLPPIIQEIVGRLSQQCSIYTQWRSLTQRLDSVHIASDVVGHRIFT